MIYSKTESGLNAIKDRSSGLSPRQRSVLIMCDGKRDSVEILKNTAGLGVTVNDLETLVSMQMLVGVSATRAQNPATAAVVAEVSPAPNPNQQLAPKASSSVSPEELKIFIRLATKELERLLGPSCESLSLKLEKSKTYDEYAIRIYDIGRVLTSIRSQKLAEDFIQTHLISRAN